VATGNVRLLADRCGIYFDLADVDGAQSRLGVADGVSLALTELDSVRVTAIVKSDDRVAYDAERQSSAGASADIRRVARDEGCRHVTRHSSSAYHDEGTGLLRDDSGSDGPMEKLARRLRDEGEGQGREVSLSLPWVDVSLRVGDRLGDVSGRGLSFGDAGAPTVARIGYDFEAQSTQLDLRMPT